jgi:hypothetical protein
MTKSLRVFGLVLIALVNSPTLAQAQKAGEKPDPKPSAKPESLRKLTVRLRDVDDKPVSGAHVGNFAYFRLTGPKTEITDAAGFRYANHCFSDSLRQLTRGPGRRQPKVFRLRFARRSCDPGRARHTGRRTGRSWPHTRRQSIARSAV